MEQLNWQEYYNRTIDRQPTSILLDCLDRFKNNAIDTTKTAIDLGCGTGRDTLELLARGWSVVAIDYQASAIESLLLRYNKIARPGKLKTSVVVFENLTSLPQVQLINAYLSLPFLAPTHFYTFWTAIENALRSGSRFCGSFFGTNDDWRTRANTTFLCKADLFKLFTLFEIEQHQEAEFKSADIYGNMKHWHIHTIIAKKL